MAMCAPILLAAVVLPVIGRLYLAMFEAPAGAGPAWIAVTAIVIEALPPLILAWSMFGLVSVLSEYGQGRFVSLRASAGFMRAGVGGAVALILQVLAPVGLAALHGQSLWPALNPNIFDLAVMMFASGLLMIGSALEAAARDLQSENDQIV
jgi:hypothetical protein